MNIVAISEQEYKDLLYSFCKLEALERGGVDNWTWYSESIRDFCDDLKVESIEELVDRKLNEMELISIGKESIQ